MKEETAREFYKLLEHACRLINEKTKVKESPDEIVCNSLRVAMGFFRSPDELLKTATKLFALAHPNPPSKRKGIVDVRATLAATAKGGAMSFFRSIPEPNREEKARMRTAIAELPFSIRKVLVQVGEQAKEFPYKRGIPTPEKLKTAQQKKEACEDIMRLLPFVENLEAACSQIGKKNGASSRTMRRYYSVYQKALREGHEPIWP